MPLLLLAATDVDARQSDAQKAVETTRQSLDVAARDLPSELVDLVLATGISIGGVDPVICAARPQAIRGNYSAEAALQRLLAGSRCDVQRVDNLTYRLVLRERPKPRPEPRPIARPVPPSPAADEEPVVVVVRHPQRLSQTPAGVSVVKPPLLAGEDTDLTLIAPHVSGMTVTNLGPGRDKIFLRGISDGVLTGRTQSTVGLYLDDTAITYNAPDPDLLLVDMARIEVLKGPQGNLYGQGALSGVVRLVTNAPDTENFSAQTGAALGGTRGGQPSWRVTGVVNLPLIKDRAALRMSLYSEKSGGFIRGRDDPPGVMNKPPALLHTASNDTERAGGRVSVTWHGDRGLQIDATATAQDLNSSNSQYVIGRKAVFAEALAVAEPHNNIFRNLSLSLTRETAAGTLKLSVNRSRHKIHSGYDARPIGRYVSIPNSGVLFYDEDQVFHLSTAEASLVSPQRGHWQWLTGLFLAHSDERFTPHLIDIYTGKTLYDEVRADRVRDVALFGKLIWTPSPRWTVSAGLRAQNSRHETDSFISDVHLVNYLPEGHIEGHIEATPVSHELMISYQPNSRLFLYALSADGFRTGGFNTTTLVNTSVPKVYAGDHIDSLEGGFKYRSKDARLSLDMAIFSADWRDIQSDQLRATGLPVTLNIGRGVNIGLETELGWQATPDLKFQLRGQLNQPKLRRYNRQYPYLAESGMPYIAKVNLSLSAQWDQTLYGHRLNHIMVVSGKDGSLLNYGVTPRVWMDGYVNIDLSSSTDIGPYSLALRVTNALSTQSNSFAYGNPFSMDTADQMTPLRPRTVWLSVSRSY